MKIKSSIKLITTFAVLTMFSGCANYYTTVKPTTPMSANIKVDQDSTKLPQLSAAVKITNFQYFLAAAAKDTIDTGFKFFAIVRSPRTTKVLIENNVKTAEDALLACSKSFRGEGGCNSMIVKRNSSMGIVLHYAVNLHIFKTQEKTNDRVFFDANEVMNSPIVKSLNPDFFVTMSK